MRYFNLQLLEGADPQSAVVKFGVHGILPDSFEQLPEKFLSEIYAFPAFRQLQLESEARTGVTNETNHSRS